MSNRSDWFFRQVVTEAELNNEFTNLETAERLQMADQEWTGIQSGLDVSESTPNDFTIDVALGVCYSRDGERINIPAKQDLDVSVDENSSTTLPGAGMSRVISVFVEFDRLLTDQRTDGNSNTVFFSQAESFTLVVRQGGDATSPSLPGDAEAFIALNASPIDPELILLGDIIRADTDTDLTNALFFTFRREFAFSMTAGAVTIQEGTVQDAISALLTELDNHVNSSPPIHPASSIGFSPGAAWFDFGTITATQTQAAIDQVVGDLAADTGAQKIGTVALPGPWADGTSGPPAVNIIGMANTLITQLANKTSEPLAGSKKVGFFASEGWADATGIAALNVQEALDEVVSTLAENATGNDGAKKIGSDATLSDVTGADIRAQIDNLATNWLKLTRSGQNVTGDNTFSGVNTFSGNNVFSGDNDFDGITDFDGNTEFGTGTVANWNGVCVIDDTAGSGFVIEATKGIRVTGDKLELKATEASSDRRFVLFTHTEEASEIKACSEFTMAWTSSTTQAPQTSPSEYDDILSVNNASLHLAYHLQATQVAGDGTKGQHRQGIITYSRNGSGTIVAEATTVIANADTWDGALTNVDLIIESDGHLKFDLFNDEGSGKALYMVAYVKVLRIEGI